ncbi:glycoside hydrolase family 18 protein [Mucilaginibacter sp. E4BP6]|uniref:glycoside hydrolase family 18 protein n=1 Tax=Mucilaginibacter sp. E4BP6 TaxID=2723089 RepID=UPI0017FAB5EF|nr:glycoside hydrolase family 18 protein [Mucilaginibacter sp. E4BP6]NYE67427.1 chitinase [Mucilaginibacter sp. E4BP6]
MPKLKCLNKILMMGLTIVAAIVFSLTVNAQTAKQHKYVIIGYVGGYHGLVDTTMVHPSKLNVINYAFVDVKNNRAFLTNLKTDTINFQYLLNLKKINPDLKVVISIGGWGWSRNFSDAVLSDTARQAFVASAIVLVRKYHLDGIDIDWEYPGMIGAGNIYRDSDKHNYTLMFRDLRHGLDSVEEETGKRMLLSAAVGGFKTFLLHTEMGKVAQYLNYVNLMTYDYSHGDSVAIHHTNLFASKQYSSNEYAATAVTDFESAGVPANKLVMGIAFYGHSVKVIDNEQHGLGAKVVGGRIQIGGGYTFIKDSLINKKGFKYYKDKNAMAPYLYNADTKQFISFDDEWSVKNKCRYVHENDMAGVMFWEYSSDKKEYLLDEIDNDL